MSSRTSQSILGDPQHSLDLLHSNIEPLIDSYWSYRDQIESSLSLGSFIRFEALITITFPGIRAFNLSFVEMGQPTREHHWLATQAAGKRVFDARS